MHVAVDEQHGNLVPVALVQRRVIEDGQLLDDNGCPGGKIGHDGCYDIPSRIAQVTPRLRQESQACGCHDNRLIAMSEATPPTPDTDRPIVAFFDVDNTLMRGASVYYVGREAFRRGIISFRDIALFAWHQFRFLAVGENRAHLSTAKARALGLARGHSEAALTDLANEIWEKHIAPQLWPETVALTKEHLAKGHEVWLITATPQIVAQVIADRLELTGALGTRVEALDGFFTGAIDGHVLHGEEKAAVAAQFARERDVNLDDCWAYSDSSNDIPLLSVVGNRVVVNPDAKLQAHAAAHGWTVLPLKRSSIRDARKVVQREAKAVRRTK